MALPEAGGAEPRVLVVVELPDYVIATTHLDHVSPCLLYTSKSVADAGDDYDYGDFIPSRPSDGIGDFIASRYPGARVIDVDAEYEGTEVELIDADRVKRELFFDRSDA